MSAVKHVVRMPLDHDGPQYDAGVDCTVEPSMTKQSFKDECDINFIMRRYEASGVIDHLNPLTAQYGDFASVVDYQTAQNIVLQSQDAFASLPAELRKRFGNDPAQLLEFLGDEKNRDEAIELGLIPAPAEPVPPMRVEVVNAGDADASSAPQPKGGSAAV